MWKRLNVNGALEKQIAEAKAKIAKLFEVSTDYLLTGDNTEPTEKQEISPDDNIKFALWGTADVDDEILDDVKHYALIARQMRENKKKE